MGSLASQFRIGAMLWLLAIARTTWAGFDEGASAFARRDYATALQEFLALANQDHPMAHVHLGAMYANGLGVPRDDSQAVFWYRKAAERGLAEGQARLGVMYVMGRGVPEDQPEAMRWFRKAADQGHGNSQLALGLNYFKDDGVSKDDRQAAFWFRKAADQGIGAAQSYLGQMYATGRGVITDDQQALTWFRLAAEQGEADAQRWLGDMYGKGQGLPRDDQQSAFWYRKAAENGDVVAQFELGRKYRRGEGVSKDDQQAALWFDKAANQGLPEAQFNLGGMYAGGIGVTQDDRQAIRWIQKAAEQGHAPAQVSLGLRYVEGKGVPKDPEKAVFWYQSAAEQGNSLAQAMLGNAYALGILVPKDGKQAYFWMLLSTSQRSSVNEAKIRDSVGAELSPEQRAETQAAARDWKPKLALLAEPFAPGRASRSIPPTGSARSDSPSSTGSGFFVASGHVVTNYHVTEGCSRLRVGGEFDGRLLKSDSHNDLSLVLSQTGSTAVATVRLGGIKVGEAATVVGFPLSGLLSGFNVTTGNVSSLAGIGGDTRRLQITAPVQPGNSGGPLLDAGGKVMGVVVSKLNALKVAQSTGDVPQNVNFAINATVLASFLDASGVDYRAAPTGSAISTQEIARRAQAFTVLVECWK